MASAGDTVLSSREHKAGQREGPSEGSPKGKEDVPLSLRERKKKLARESMLQAAEALIERDGFDNARMRDIAELAGVSYQTLYNYFPTKARIVQALLTDDVDATDTDVIAILKRGDDLLTTLFAVLEVRMNSIAHHNRDLWRHVVIEYMKRSDDFAPAINEVSIRTHVRLGQLLTDAQQSGRLDPYVDTDVLVSAVEAIIDQAFFLYVLIEAEMDAVLVHLKRQIELVLTPYLRSA